MGKNIRVSKAILYFTLIKKNNGERCDLIRLLENSATGCNIFHTNKL